MNPDRIGEKEALPARGRVDNRAAEAEGSAKTAWERALESSLKRVSTRSSSEPDGCCPLVLSPEPRTDGPYPGVRRELYFYPADLLAQLRAVLAGEEAWPFYVWGPVGTGKTCLALALVDHVPARRRAGEGRYYTVSELCDELIQSMQGRLGWQRGADGGTIHPEQWWSRLGKSGLLVIDELGTRSNVSDFQFNTLERAMDERKGKPLVLVSNKSPAGIAEVYDDRIASRCTAGTVVKLEGPDRRQRKNRLHYPTPGESPPPGQH